MTLEEYQRQSLKEAMTKRPGNLTEVDCRCGKGKLYSSLVGSIYSPVLKILFCRVCCSECSIYRDPANPPSWNPKEPLV